MQRLFPRKARPKCASLEGSFTRSYPVFSFRMRCIFCSNVMPNWMFPSPPGNDWPFLLPLLGSNWRSIPKSITLQLIDGIVESVVTPTGTLVSCIFTCTESTKRDNLAAPNVPKWPSTELWLFNTTIRCIYIRRGFMSWISRTIKLKLIWRVSVFWHFWREHQSPSLSSTMFNYCTLLSPKPIKPWFLVKATITG